MTLSSFSPVGEQVEMEEPWVLSRSRDTDNDYSVRRLVSGTLLTLLDERLWNICPPQTLNC